MQVDVQAIKERVAAQADILDRVRHEVGKVLVGQKHMVDRLLAALLCGGHVLLEGVPGLAKTLTVKTLAAALSTKFQRIQFTPDLLPADLIGTLIYNPREGTFSTKKGPIFANVILADEINRAPSKVQSALLEAMQEHQVTIGEETFRLEEPFLVMATQNPIEQEGTYPLPEAQLDRFMFNILIHYPTEAQELDIVRRTTAIEEPKVESVLSGDEVLRIQRLVRQVPVADHVVQYAIRLTRATRVREQTEQKPAVVEQYVSWGTGPRASQFLILAAKARAILSGSSHVMPEHVRAVALPVMRHRIITNFNAEADGVTTDDIIRTLLDTIPVDGSSGEDAKRMDAVMG